MTRIVMIGGKHNGRTSRPYRPTTLPREQSYPWLVIGVMFLALALIVLEFGR